MELVRAPFLFFADSMKVLLINSHQFGNQENSQWDAAQVCKLEAMSSYTQYLVGEFYKLGVPVVHAHALPNLEATYIKFLAQQPDYAIWYSTQPTTAQHAYSCYYRAICELLAQAGNSYWINDQAGQVEQLREQGSLSLASATEQYLELLTQLEAAVSLDYEGMSESDLINLEQQLLTGKVINRIQVSVNSAAKITRAQAVQEQQACYPQVSSSVKLKDGTSLDLAEIRLTYPESVQGLKQQCIFTTLASKVDWKTRAHEWILVLDEQAILHPQFFSKIALLLQYKISPEVLVLGEEQIEQQLATTLATHGLQLPNLLTNETQLLVQEQQLVTLLEQLGVNLSVSTQVVQSNATESQATGDQEAKILTQEHRATNSANKTTLDEFEDDEDEFADEDEVISSQKCQLGELVSNPLVAQVLANLQHQGAQAWQNRVAQQCRQLWNEQFVAEQEYKRAYQRYSERFKCYFFVKRSLGYVTPATLLVRANVFGQMAQMSSKYPYALVNDTFARGESHGFETAYVRGVWAVAPQQLTYLHPSKRDKASFLGFITRWANNTNAYIQQLKLTASLDSGDLLNQ